MTMSLMFRTRWSASGGKNWVEKCRFCQNGYCLIFMDLNMPVMDGYEATKIIWELFQHSEQRVRIVGTTANEIS